jgi:dCMP deaminase
MQNKPTSALAAENEVGDNYVYARPKTAVPSDNFVPDSKVVYSFDTDKLPSLMGVYHDDFDHAAAILPADWARKFAQDIQWGQILGPKLQKFLKFVPSAKAAEGMSKDPSTKVGAILIDDDFNIRATGYNGFPRGVVDDPKRYADRANKLLMIVHAEVNAITQAARTGVSVNSCTLIVTALYPCSTCTGAVIQAGIKTVLAPDVNMPARWASNWVLAKQMFKESGVKVFAYDPADTTKIREIV